MHRLLLGVLLAAVGCSSAEGDAESLTHTADTGMDASNGDDTGGGLSGDATPVDSETGSACVPPDMLIALDRTLTMHRQPNGDTPTDGPTYASSKWYLAITAIERMARAPLDTTIRFGLELWPKESPGCITLTERVTDSVSASNPSCETAEILVSPAIGTGTRIGDALDPATTKICRSTPTGDGLIAGAAHLAGMTESGRSQYILLVTDGADWDQSCPTPDPLTITRDNAQKGIKTFVLGFSSDGTLSPGGVGVPFLNNMACAGQTAPDFATNCTLDPATNGYVAVDATNGPRLFFQADDAAGLDAAMKSVTGQICCDCPR
jgi:hypothetical protein